MNKASPDFWSHRKAKVAQEAEAEAVVEKAPVEDLTDAEVLAKFGLPDPDMLKLGDDIKGFMSKAVPEHLRRRALRKLWRTNPVLACLDGLNDYDGDFTDLATVMPDMKTAYQVGKGMLAHLEAVARQTEVLLASEAEVDVCLTQGEDSDHAPEGDDVTIVTTTRDDTVDQPPNTGRPARMRLQFDDTASQVNA